MCKQVHALCRYCLQSEKVHEIHRAQEERCVHTVGKSAVINRKVDVFNTFSIPAHYDTLYHETNFVTPIAGPEK